MPLRTLICYEALKKQMTMATPKSKKKLFGFCSLLMALLFAYSASVQLNDPDWYFWFPLYTFACVVNLIHGIFSLPTIRKTAKLALWLGLFLFVKVVVEDFVSGTAGFWSLDLSERLVREKIGSGLAVISMFLQLEASSAPLKKKNNEVARFVGYGMAVLVGISFGLPFVFFVIQKGEMKFGSSN